MTTTQSCSLQCPAPHSRRAHPFLFLFNDTATTEIYTLSLHDALPIFAATVPLLFVRLAQMTTDRQSWPQRSEEHTSELQSRLHLVCLLLLEKKQRNRGRRVAVGEICDGDDAVRSRGDESDAEPERDAHDHAHPELPDRQMDPGISGIGLNRQWLSAPRPHVRHASHLPSLAPLVPR